MDHLSTTCRFWHTHSVYSFWPPTYHAEVSSRFELHFMAAPASFTETQMDFGKPGRGDFPTPIPCFIPFLAPNLRPQKINRVPRNSNTLPPLLGGWHPQKTMETRGISRQVAHVVQRARVQASQPQGGMELRGTSRRRLQIKPQVF